MKRILTVTLISIVCHFAFGQNIFSSTIVDEQSQEAIPYVNIGIIGKDVGTVSEINGMFSITLNDEYDADTLRISCIGYESKDYIVRDFRENQNKLDKILLKPSNILLEDIVILGKKLKTKLLGVKTTSKKLSGGFSSNKLGNEVAIKIKIKKSPTYIKEFSTHIVKNLYDTVQFRLNIYNIKDGLPNENILKENIIITTSIKEGLLTVDLSKYNIVVEDDFFVALEWIEDLGEGGLFFSVKPFTSAIHERKTSQGNWNKVGPIGVGFTVLVAY